MWAGGQGTVRRADAEVRKSLSGTFRSFRSRPAGATVRRGTGAP